MRDVEGAKYVKTTTLSGYKGLSQNRVFDKHQYIVMKLVLFGDGKP